jgi:hypothetical protein
MIVNPKENPQLNPGHRLTKPWSPQTFKHTGVLRSQILNHKKNLKLTTKPNTHVNHMLGAADILFLYPKLEIKLNLQLNSRVKGTGVEAPADMLFLSRPLSSLALPVVEEVRCVLFFFFEIRFLGDWARVYRKHASVCVCVCE